MFLLHINDLPLHVENSLVDLYVDDTTLSYSCDTLSETNILINRDVENVAKWCDVNRLIVNEKKTKATVICSSQKRLYLNMLDFNIKFDDKSVQYCDRQKILGAHIDDNLVWSTHASYVESRLSSLL